MKKSLVIVMGILIIGAIVVIGYFSKNHSLSTANIFQGTMKPESIAPVTQESCYEYKQSPTKDAPYRVTEKLKLVVGNELVTGTKTGFQSGPDMTNGYEGTITGSRSGNTITAIFAYTVEGSSNNEQEEYQITPISLIKHRYPLVESNGILVPDKNKDGKDIIYTRMPCTEY